MIIRNDASKLYSFGLRAGLTQSYFVSCIYCGYKGI